MRYSNKKPLVKSFNLLELSFSTLFLISKENQGHMIYFKKQLRGNVVHKVSCGFPESLFYSVWGGTSNMHFYQAPPPNMSQIKVRRIILQCFKAQALGPDYVGLNLSIVIYQLYNHRQMTASPCASVSLFVRWTNDSICLPGLL